MRSLEVWPKSYVLFRYVFGIIYSIMPDLVRESAVLGSNFCPVCEFCHFTIHSASHSPGPQIVSLQSHGLIFMDKPFMGGCKVHFLWHDLLSLPNFDLFWTKIAKHLEMEWSYQKNKCHIWSNHTQIPICNQFIFIMWERNFGTWKWFHSHSFGH